MYLAQLHYARLRNATVTPLLLTPVRRNQSDNAVVQRRGRQPVIEDGIAKFSDGSEYRITPEGWRRIRSKS